MINLSIQSKKRVLLLCSIASLLFNIFFMYNNFGFSVLFFNLILLFIYYSYNKRKSNFNLKLFSFVSLFILLLSIPFARFEFPLYKTFNIILIPLLYGLLVTNKFEFNIQKMILFICSGTFLPLGKTHKYFKYLNYLYGQKNKTTIKVLLGLTAATLLMIIIIPLLLSSDEIFRTTLSELFEFINIEELIKFIFRIVIFLIIASYLFAQLLYEPKESTTNSGINKSKPFFDTIIATTFLLCIDLVYLVYCYIQIRYLFIGTGNLPDGVTYSAYAREGFFQLVFVTFINIFVILIFNHFKQSKWLTNSLLLVTVLCTYVMTCSAFYKMSLYESTYGYTRLRLLVYLFLIVEFIVLIPLSIGAIQPKFRYLESIVIILVVYYMAINFINIDAFVAKNNIQRFQEINKIDMDYLETLSIDALPQIEKLTLSSDKKAVEFAKNKIISSYTDLQQEEYIWYEKNIAQIQCEKLFYQQIDNTEK